VSGIPRVLFVCVGNSCRSQLAEALARHHGAGRIEAASAGTHPAGAVSRGALEVLGERGIDTSSLRSKGLDEVDIHSFDRVIAMGCHPVDEICPARYAGRKEDWDIPDPIGQPAEVYRRTRDLVERKVLDLLDRIGRAPARREEG